MIIRGVDCYVSRRPSTKTFSCFYIVVKIITRFAQTDDFSHYNQGIAIKSFLTHWYSMFNAAVHSPDIYTEYFSPK